MCFLKIPKGESKGIESSASLQALIDSGVTVGEGEYRIVDVRPDRKYAKGHIPTAINVPNGDVAKAKVDLPKDKKIILYCETGGRAQAAARNKLAPAGYTQVYNWGDLENGKARLKNSHGPFFLRLPAIAISNAESYPLKPGYPLRKTQ